MFERIRSMPHGPLVLMGGIGALGATTYLFLLLAGQSLGDADYAPLGAMWVLVFLACPAIFFPVEQELSRAIASRRVHGDGARPVVVRAAVIVACTVAGLVVAAVLGRSPLLRLLSDDNSLYLALVICLATFAVEYIVRGLLAGSERLAAYGVFITLIGSCRVIVAALLMVTGEPSAGTFGLLVAIAPLAAASITFMVVRTGQLLQPGSHARWSELTTSLGNLVAASVLSQVLVNSAPLMVKYNATASEQALSGAFTKATILTRVPLFLFQALQAMMLPRLTRLATEGDKAGFRREFRNMCALVTALGLLATGVAAILGDWALRLFGSDYPLPRRDLILLSLGNTAFLLALTTAQALVAIRKQSKTVIAWAAGLALFGALCATDWSVVLRVELALIVGATVSFLAMGALVARARIEPTSARESVPPVNA